MLVENFNTEYFNTNKWLNKSNIIHLHNFNALKWKCDQVKG